MLAYELYLMNRKSKRNLDATSKDPIKKIFYSKNTIKIDPTTNEAFGTPKTNKTKFLQEWLTMPLLTTSAEKLNLPDKRTGKGDRSK